MNLSGYKERDKKMRVHAGFLSLMKDMKVINANESMYQFLGKNSARAFTDLIHPEDLECYNRAVDHLAEREQHLILRVMDCQGDYRCMYMILSYSNRVEDDFRIIDIDIQDVIEAHGHYDTLCFSVNKYRKFMTFSSNIYLEYYYESRFLNIFEYNNGRSYTLYAHDIDVAFQQVEDDAFLDKEKKEEFRELYDLLTNGVDNIDVSVDGVIFGLDKFRLRIKGGILFKDDEKYMLAATVTKQNYGDYKEEKYYMTSYAIDTATNTYNKRAITEICKELLRKNQDEDEYVHYLCMMDVDDFKLINDHYGHMTGDEVMARVAGTVRSVIGEQGYVGRFGGDEFLVLTDKVKSADELINLLKTIRKNVLYSCKDIAPGVNVTFSIGIAKFPDHGNSYEKLFSIADHCVYIAKEKGKNRFILYDPEIHGTFDNNEEPLGENGVSTVSVIKKYSDVYNIIRDLDCYGDAGIRECLDNVRNTFDIDGISIFDNESCEKLYVSGNYLNPYGIMDFMDQLQSQVDANGMYVINRVFSIAEQFPAIYEKLKMQGNSGCLFLRGKRFTVEYDIFDRPRKWSENDKGMLMMIGKLLDEKL